jgi:hypothetical protein
LSSQFKGFAVLGADDYQLLAIFNEGLRGAVFYMRSFNKKVIMKRSLGTQFRENFVQALAKA